jgi:hypothetical protein
VVAKFQNQHFRNKGINSGGGATENHLGKSLATTFNFLSNSLGNQVGEMETLLKYGCLKTVWRCQTQIPELMSQQTPLNKSRLGIFLLN